MDNFNPFRDLIRMLIETVIDYFTALPRQELIKLKHIATIFYYKFLKASAVSCLLLSIAGLLITWLTNSKFTFEFVKSIADFFVFALVFFLLMLSSRGDYIKAEQFRNE